MASELNEITSISELDDITLQIVGNVFNLCRSEAINNRLLGGLLTSYIDRASFYTGLPKAVFKAIKDKHTSMYHEPDPFLWTEIRKVLKKFYSKLEQPTIEIVYAMLQKVHCPSFEIFKIQLFEFGFKNIQLKTPRGEMIMEDPKVTFERYRYIKKLMKARSMDRKIYYLSVKAYSKNENTMIPFRIDNMDYILSQPKHFFLYHIVSKDRYENGLFTYSYDEKQLVKWVLNIVGPMLQESSLVILDNSCHCGKPSNQHNISSYHPKSKMIKWLKLHNLPCEPNMHKAELFELIEKCSVKRGIDNVENILKSMGHNVLYLPKVVDDISPVQLFWKYVNNKLARKKLMYTDEGMNKLKDFIVEEISSFGSQGLWPTYDLVVKKTEEEVFALDTEIDNYLDKYDFDFDSISE